MNVGQQKGQEHHDDQEADGTRPPSSGTQQTFTAFDSQRALTVHLSRYATPRTLFAPTGGFAPTRERQAWTA